MIDVIQSDTIPRTIALRASFGVDTLRIVSGVVEGAPFINICNVKSDEHVMGPIMLTFENEEGLNSLIDVALDLRNRIYRNEIGCHVALDTRVNALEDEL